MAYYNTCPDCGATLDPGEHCDCTAKDDNAAQSHISPTTNQSLGTFITESPYLLELEQFYNDLPIGIEHRISREELAKRWGVSERKARKIIHDIREHLDNGDDFFVYSCSISGRKGYCLTDKPYYRQMFIREMSERGRQCFIPAKKARRIERDKLRRRDSCQNRLAFYRLQLNMSQEDVARIVKTDNLNVPTMSRYERGQSMPTIAQLSDLCALYGCEPPDIYPSDYLDAYGK